MNKLWLFVKRNLRKGVGQSISFMGVLLAASLLLNLSLITIFNFDASYDKTFEDLHSPHVSIGLLGRDDEPLKKFVENDSRVESYEKTPGLILNAKIDLFDSEMSTYALILDRSEYRELGQSRVVTELTETEKMRIDPHQPAAYVSNLLHTTGDYELGDTLVLKTEKESYALTIAGFTENIFLGTLNTMFTGIELDHEDYLKFEDRIGPQGEGLWCKMRLHNMGEANIFATDSFGSFGEDNHHIVSTMDSGLIKYYRTLNASIISTIMLVFSLIILAVALVVVRFRIQNSIEDDMRNIGALKAIGYTGKQMIASYSMQFALLAGVAALLGTAFSYAVLPYLADMYSGQTGLRWIQGFDFLSTFITVGAMVLTVSLMAWASARVSGKIEPITALRTGINTHSFKKNLIPLERFNKPLNVILALKRMLMRARQNIMIVVIVAAVAFAAMFAVVFYYNVNINNDRFFSMVSGEVPDVMLIPKDSQQTEFYRQEMADYQEVAHSVLYDSFRAEIFGVHAYLDITSDFNKINNRGLFEGRSPIHNNEVALCPQLLTGTDKTIGDTVTITYRGISKDFIITGYVQSANQMGRDLQLTTDGMRQMDPDFKLNKIYLYCMPDTDIEKLLHQLEQTYPDAFQSTTNFQELSDANTAVYKKMVSYIASAIIAITLGILTLVLYLVIKTAVLKGRKDLGIQKALGYTGLQLVVQMAVSYVPVVAVGLIVGSLLGYMGMNPLIGILFRSMGIMKVNLYVFGWMVIFVIGVFIVFAFAVSLGVARHIRSISPFELFNQTQ